MITTFSKKIFLKDIDQVDVVVNYDPPLQAKVVITKNNK